MNIFPAIDIIGGKAVRLVRGDYAQMTVYNDSPLAVAKEFEAKGAKYLHIVDLEGAKDGTTPNLDVIAKIIKETSLLVEVGGGIRSEEVLEKYIGIGVWRVILGTAAVSDPEFLRASVKKYGDKIAVGADVKDKKIAIKGWLETTEIDIYNFFSEMQSIGVKGIICTDISKDGLLGGTNTELYRSLSEKFSIEITASGGVSTLGDIQALLDMKLYGAILGKALYTGNLELSEAIALCEVAK